MPITEVVAASVILANVKRIRFVTDANTLKVNAKPTPGPLLSAIKGLLHAIDLFLPMVTLTLISLF